VITVIGAMIVDLRAHTSNSPALKAIRQTIEAKFGSTHAVIIKSKRDDVTSIEYVWLLAEIPWAKSQLMDVGSAFYPDYCMYLRYPEGKLLLSTILNNWDTVSWVREYCVEPITKLRINHVNCVVVVMAKETFEKLKQKRS